MLFIKLYSKNFFLEELWSILLIIFIANIMTQVCTSCHSIVGNEKFFCDSCGKVQLIKFNQEISYFSIFGLRPSIDIDNKILEIHFAGLINIMHPDRFIYKSEDDKHIAEINTAAIYKAYATLTSDLRICEYIINSRQEVNNNEILDDDNGFLMEKMDLYDELHSISSNIQCNDFRKKLDEIYYSRLSILRNNIRQQNFHNQNKALQKLKFIQHLIEALEKKVYMLEMDKNSSKT